MWTYIDIRVNVLQYLSIYDQSYMAPQDNIYGDMRPHICDHILVIVILGAAAEAEAEAGVRTGQLEDN